MESFDKPLAEYSIQALIEILHNFGDETEAAMAVEELGNRGEAAEAAIPEILQMVDSPDSEMRGSAIWALSKIRPNMVSDFISLWMNDLESDDVSVRIWAIRKLRNSISLADFIVPALMKRIQDPDKYVRYAAVEALESVEADGTIVLALTEALKDTYKNTRMAAARALTRFGAAAVSAVPALTELLKDTDKYVRAAVVEALGRIGIGATSAVPTLITMLTDTEKLAGEYPYVIEKPMGDIVANALKRIGTPEALDALQENHLR